MFGTDQRILEYWSISDNKEDGVILSDQSPEQCRVSLRCFYYTVNFRGIWIEDIFQKLACTQFRYSSTSYVKNRVSNIEQLLIFMECGYKITCFCLEEAYFLYNVNIVHQAFLNVNKLKWASVEMKRAFISTCAYFKNMFKPLLFLKLILLGNKGMKMNERVRIQLCCLLCKIHCAGLGPNTVFIFRFISCFLHNTPQNKLINPTTIKKN